MLNISVRNRLAVHHTVDLLKDPVTFIWANKAIQKPLYIQTVGNPTDGPRNYFTGFGMKSVRQGGEERCIWTMALLKQRETSTVHLKTPTLIFYFIFFKALRKNSMTGCVSWRKFCLPASYMGQCSSTIKYLTFLFSLSVQSWNMVTFS